MSINDCYAISTIHKLEKRIGRHIRYEVHRGGVSLPYYEVQLAKKVTRFRMNGLLDYAHFTVKGLGEAMEAEEVGKYYIEMLKDPRSPENVWKDKEKEAKLKEEYAKAAGFPSPELALEYYTQEVYRGEPEEWGDDDIDEHIGCFSYPECELSPTGCVVRNGSYAEPFGHRD
jgi:hypothetical protein